MTMKNKQAFLKHWLIMLICCVVVILAIVILPKYFNIGSFAFLLVLLCPLSHIVLMKLFMDKRKGSDTKNGNKNNSCH